MKISIYYVYIAGGMKDADIGVGWIDNNGKIHFQVL